ncbi:MAG TPA: O-antigen ligase family protein [Ramlibacter sp.]|nr:O-antigen ligase family protein [Ramlibacter sp.]
MRIGPCPVEPRADLLRWVFPAMLALTALDVLMSGRDLTQAYTDLERSAEAAAPLVERGALQVWAQRAVSLLLIVATLQRIAPYVLQGRPAPAPVLSAAFLLYWLGSIAAPGLLGAHPRVSHEYAYPLLLGLACTMVDPREHERILLMLRDALVVFMFAGLALLPIRPEMVLDTAYTQGLLPGLPRYGGLANSPVMMGMLAQVTLLVVWAQPFQRRWLHRAAWVVGLAVLFVAQSKTAWLSFLLGGACMWTVQGAPAALQGLSDPRRASAGVGLCLGVIFATLAALVSTLVLDVPGRVGDFLDSREGAQLASLTGRDRIWVVALEEWGNHPVFGYGLTMWNSEYRQEIGMPQATHAHNQLLDTLGRAGLVGAVGLALYAVVLLGLSMRHAAAGRGLGLAMAVTLVLLSVSEVPLLLVDYGSHLLVHYLLVVCVAAAAAGCVRRPRPLVPAPSSARPAPVRRLARPAWSMPRLRLEAGRLVRPARRTLLASGMPLVMLVASPLAGGSLPPDGPAAGAGEPLRLKLERCLGPAACAALKSAS